MQCWRLALVESSGVAAYMFLLGCALNVRIADETRLFADEEGWRSASGSLNRLQWVIESLVGM